MKLNVKGILLDLDGTVVDSREAYLEAAKAAFAATGRKIVDTKIAMEIPRRIEQNLSIDDLIEGIETQKFLDAYLHVYCQAASTKAKPMSNVAETLKKLSEKTKIALITMRYVPAERVTRELEEFGLDNYFLFVTTALDANSPKPSPEALIESARRLGIPISECAVVGDSVVDVRAGKYAGMRTVSVLSGIFTKEELEKENPDLILESINELPSFLE